jgi:hypothetical protein
MLPPSGSAGAVPAHVSSAGVVRLSQSSGSVDSTPMFASATAARPCPAGYGSDALLRVGPPEGPFTNLARPLVDGGYDTRGVTARPNRSFTTALGGAPPAAGQWWIVVECFSQVRGMHPDRFITPITVTGRTWRAGAGADSAGSAPATATAPGPDASGLGASGPQGQGASAPAQSQTVGARSEPDPPLARVWWAVALLLALAAAGAAAGAARRFGRR